LFICTKHAIQRRGSDDSECPEGFELFGGGGADLGWCIIK
jgi:hypothetical protein